MALSLKRMMRKLSVGRRPRRALRMNALLASIGSPCIEPEASRTKTISSGVMSRARGVFAVDPEAEPRPLQPGTKEERYVRQRTSYLARTTRERFRVVAQLRVIRVRL